MTMRIITKRGHSPKTTNLEFPDTPAGRRIWIKAALAQRGWNLSSLARHIGVSRSTTRMALIRPSAKMEREIARHLDLLPEEIWPERYEEFKPWRGQARRLRGTR